MQPDMSYTGEIPVDPLIFEVVPFGADQRHSTYTVYEDSDKGDNYIRGEFTHTRIDVTRESKSEYHVTVAAAEGSYPGMIEQRAYEIRLDTALAASSVLLNGKSLGSTDSSADAGWRNDAAAKQVIVRLPKQSVHTESKVTINLQPVE
jgi:hypothetical protein